MTQDDPVESPRRTLERIQAKVARIPTECPLPDFELRMRGEPFIRGPLHPNPVLSEAELHAFDAEYRVELPEEYRLFLREVGDGGVGPGQGLSRLAEALQWSPSRDLATPFPYSRRLYHEMGPDRFYEERSTEEAQPWPGILYLTEVDPYCEAYLVIAGEDRGTVWGYGPHNCGWTPECPNSDLDNKWGLGEPRSFFRWYEDWLDDWLHHAAGGEARS